MPNSNGTMTITEEEGKQLRETIRMEERGKLNNRITQLETMEVEYTNMKARFAAQEVEINSLRQSLGTAQGELETLRKSKGTDGKSVDVQKLIEETKQATLSSMSADVTQKITELQTQVARMDMENKTLRLENYKSRRVQEEHLKGSKFIDELIQGNTEVEIEQSLARAKETYNRHFPGAVSTATPPAAVQAGAVTGAGASGAGAPAARGPTPVTQPAVGDAAAPAPTGAEGRPISDLMSEIRAKRDFKGFAEARGDLKAAAAEIYNKTAGTNAFVR